MRKKDYESEINDLLREDSKKIKIPDEIMPGNMEKRLAKKVRKVPYALMSSVAAALLLIVAVPALLFMNEINKKADKTEEVSKEDQVISDNKNKDNMYVPMNEKVLREKLVQLTGNIKDCYMYEDIVPESDGESANNNQVNGGESDYSQTNIQVEGVDEADIVKTDGNYIYILQEIGGDVNLKIVQVNNGEMSLVSTYNIMGDLTGSSYCDGYSIACDMYLEGDKVCIEVKGFYYDNQCQLLVYDVSDRSNPELCNTILQDGSYYTSRKVGNILYTVSIYSAAQYDNEDYKSKVIPEINGQKMDCNDVYITDCVETPSYVVITAYDIIADKVVDEKSILSGSDIVYVSNNNIYLVEYSYNSSRYVWSNTQITKIAYDDKGNIEPLCSESISGKVFSQFSIDEKDETLRLVVEVDNDNENKVEVLTLDSQLQEIGSLCNPVGDENIKSVRFVNDTAYFVTFKTMDPLFAVDVSDPTDIKLLGELKIPGFSTYLHPYGDNLLLGIGYDANTNTGLEENMKMSMFDISDPANIVELSTYSFPENYGSSALYNYKAILANFDKNIIGFCVNGYRENDLWSNGEVYQYDYNLMYSVFSYDKEKGFVNAANINIESDNYVDVRGLYVGNTLYIVDTFNKITAVSLDTYTEIGKLEY